MTTLVRAYLVVESLFIRQRTLPLMHKMKSLRVMFVVMVQRVVKFICPVVSPSVFVCATLV